MNKFAIAAALTLIASGSIAQEASFYAATESQNASALSIESTGQASMSVESPSLLQGNINWNQNYSGK
ncbi:MAG: hypothetical protein Q8Q62_21765 [Mesorhizobium sp.]|nr:hypothetical protein [Mesorhizobium sp.]